MSKLYYKGETIFLYVRFYDENQIPANNVIDAKVRILHEKNGNIYEDMPWIKMNNISNNEYYSKFRVPYDFDCGLYDIIYQGTINGKEATIIESFHVINKSEIYENAIKLYGYINDDTNQCNLSNVSIEIISNDGQYVTQSYTGHDGYWETYLYPGDYMCNFIKEGYNELNVNFQLGNENNEVLFNNVSLESNQKRLCGNGLCKISDSYILKNGIPLDGLNVNVYSIEDPINTIATSITDRSGQWTVFLDPGYYLLKVTGESMNHIFDKVFRLKIDDDLNYDLENIESNKAILNSSNLNEGNGTILHQDYVYDSKGNPIPDVQIIAYLNNSPVAECYTDVSGKYIMYLNPGKYQLDIYHPSFNQFPLTNLVIK